MSLNFNQQNRDNFIREIAEKTPKGSKVLDIGAGACPYKDFFNDVHYESQDFCQLEEKFLIGGAYGKIDFVSEIDHIPVPDSSYDVIICTEVIEHVPEPIKAFKEFYRILKPGGQAIITAPLSSHLHQLPYHFYGGFTPYFYRKFLAENGFENIQIEHNGKYFSFIAQEVLRIPIRTLRMSVVLFILLFPFMILASPLIILLHIFHHALDKLDQKGLYTLGFHVTANKKLLN